MNHDGIAISRLTLNLLYAWVIISYVLLKSRGLLFCERAYFCTTVCWKAIREKIIIQFNNDVVRLPNNLEWAFGFWVHFCFTRNENSRRVLILKKIRSLSYVANFVFTHYIDPKSKRSFLVKYIVRDLMPLMIQLTDYRRLLRKSPSLHGRKLTPTPKFFATAKAYFVCHIGPNFHFILIYIFIGCP